MSDCEDGDAIEVDHYGSEGSYSSDVDMYYDNSGKAAIEKRKHEHNDDSAGEDSYGENPDKDDASNSSPSSSDARMRKKKRPTKRRRPVRKVVLPPKGEKLEDDDDFTAQNQPIYDVETRDKRKDAQRRVTEIFNPVKTHAVKNEREAQLKRELFRDLQRRAKAADQGKEVPGAQEEVEIVKTAIDIQHRRFNSYYINSGMDVTPIQLLDMIWHKDEWGIADVLGPKLMIGSIAVQLEDILARIRGVVMKEHSARQVATVVDKQTQEDKVAAERRNKEITALCCFASRLAETDIVTLGELISYEKEIFRETFDNPNCKAILPEYFYAKPK